MRRLLLLPCLAAAFAAAGQTLEFRTLAGTTDGGGYADGAALSARFSSPSGIAVCADAIFIADTSNHVIRRLSRDGNVTTWAAAADFRFPTGLAADAQCNLIVADRDHHTIRRISAAGVVTTIAGASGTPGNTNGAGSAARFNAPQDVALDTDGSIWVADQGNRSIRRIAPDGRVSTVTTFPAGNTVQPNAPLGLALDASGVLHVADYLRRLVVRVTRAGAVTVEASNVFAGDVAFGADGALYVADYSDQLLQRVESDGKLTAVAGTRSRSGHRDGSGGTVMFNAPRGIALDADGTLLITENNGCVLRRATTGGEVTTIAGSASAGGPVDGIGTAARFESAIDVDVDANGIAYVADSSAIRRIAADGTTSTIATGFGGASGVAVEPSGTLVVIDGNTVRRVTLDGEVTTIAGTAGTSGFRDDVGSAARFNLISGIAVAPDGTIYVTDTINHAVRKIAGNVVTTLARDTFSLPMGIDVDRDGNVYVWDENKPEASRITPDGQVTVVAHDDRLNTLVQGIAVAADGTIYLGGLRTHALYRIQPGSSAIERFAGSETSIGNQNGTRDQARFYSPTRLDVAPDGRLFVRDSNRAIRVASEPVAKRRRSSRHP